MIRLSKHHLPEIGLILLGTFFCLRELGTFPAAWTDDSLFMIIAKQVADGRGYTLPILSHEWAYPYFLAIGPTLILPVALFIKIFGFSVAVARVPMVMYLAGSSMLMYFFAKKMAGKSTARWSTALLITLSAFINTGKPVLGEVPGFFFLILGLMLMLKAGSWKKDMGIGLCFGLSVLTKLTYGLLYPALGIAWLLAAVKRDTKELKSLTIIGLISLIVYTPLRLMEMASHKGLTSDFEFMFGKEGLQILHGNPEILLRAPFVFYGVMLLLGLMGLWIMRRKLPHSLWIIIGFLIISFTIYFLSSFGWYRHLLPAHLLLIPFVSIVILTKLPKKIAVALLLFFVLGQGYWQYSHQGSSSSPAAAEAAAYIQENLQEEDLVVQVAQIYVRLDRNPNWLFLTNPILTLRLPEEYVNLTEEERCYSLIRGLLPEDENPVIIGRKFVIIPPPEDC